MIKKINKLLINSIAVFAILGVNNVTAKSFDATLGYDALKFGSEVKYDLNSQGKAQNHGETYEAHLTSGGKQYVAYCIDPIKPATGGLKYSCTNKFPKRKNEDPRPAYAYALNHFIDKGWTRNHRVIKSLTVRFLAEHYQLNDSNNNAGYAKAIAKYVGYVDASIKAENTYNAQKEKYQKCEADNEKNAKKNDDCNARKSEIQKLEKEIDDINGQILDQSRQLDSCMLETDNDCEHFKRKIDELESEQDALNDKLESLDNEYDNKCSSKKKIKDCSDYKKKMNDAKSEMKKNNDLAKKTLFDDKGWVTTATKIYKDALKEASDNSDDNSNFKGTIKYKLDENSIKTEGTNYQVTYNVTSSVKVEKSDIKFTCENCEVVKTTWDDSGKSGTVTIKAIGKEDDAKYNCNYKLQAQYIDDNSGPCTQADIYYCNTGKGKQYYVTSTCEVKGEQSGSIGNMNNATYSDIPNGSITGMIPSGNDFYNKYCVNPNACTEQTEIKTPTICDDASDRQIEITGPSKQITKCVLHGKDEAANTYQDTNAVKATNKYCSVHCKEDYTITMPGAQYSDSGRYFKLKNTVVNATRTCYTAGPGKDTNIAIENYINDIIEAQKEVVSSRDAFLKALATNSVLVETIESDTVGTMSRKAPVSYEGVEISSCNSETGVCNIRNVTRQTDNYLWGGKAGASEPDWMKMVNDASSAMSSARKKMANISEDIKSCYNFTNELCLDSKIDFDYNETYNKEVEYSQISKDVKNNTEVTYKTGKGIDDAYTTNNAHASLETIKYLSCGDSGCGYDFEVKDISTLNTKYYYRKVISSGTAQYNSKTEFQTQYPTGIVDKINDGNKDHLLYNYSYLGAVFPVALKTDKGVYNWTLKIREIGQYNDNTSCKSGRLNAVAKKIDGKLYSDLGYGCVYIVNCPDCPIDCECPSDLPDGYTCIKEQNGKDSVCTIRKKDENCPDCEVECTNCIFNFKDNFAYRTVGLGDINPNDRTIGTNWSDEKGKTTKEAIESKAEKAYLDENIQYSYQLDANNMKKIRDMNRQTGTYAAADLDYQNYLGVKNAYGLSSFLNEGMAKGYFTQLARSKEWTLWPEDKRIEGSVGPAWK